MSAKFNR